MREVAKGACVQSGRHVRLAGLEARVLVDGQLYATSSRVDWATLLRRTFETDIRVCARCGGGLTVRAVVTDAESIARLVTALRRGRAPPAAA